MVKHNGHDMGMHESHILAWRKDKDHESGMISSARVCCHKDE